MGTTLLEAMAHAEEFGEIGFTNEDRKAIIALGVHFEHLFKRLDSYDARLTLIERGSASKSDLEKLERDLREEHRELARDLRSEIQRTEQTMASKIAETSQKIADTERSVAKTDESVQKINIRLAIWSGVIMAAGAAFEFTIRLVWK